MVSTRFKVTIQPADLTGEIRAGESLLDAGQTAGVEMVAGCFNCSCGTCAVEVTAGATHLEPAGPEEIAVLEMNGHPPGRFRLACTARVNDGDVTIRQLD
jgi:ferredoxin